MATMTQQTDLVVNTISDRADDAQNLLATTLTLLGDAQASLSSGITAILNNMGVLPDGVSFNLSQVNASYVAPTAVAPTVPDATTVAIGDAEWDRVFQRAAAQEARVGVAEEYTAASEAASRGLAVPALVSSTLLSLAQQRTMDRISSVAETSAIEQAKAAREDILSLTDKSITLFNAKWSTQVSSENVRREYEGLKMAVAMEPTKFTAEYNLKATELAVISSMRETVDIMQIYAQLVNALISGSAVDLGSRSSYSFGQQVYNPTEGEVIQYPV